MPHSFSTHGFTVEFDDNSPEVLAALQNAVERGLGAIGEKAVKYAQAEIRKSKPYADGKPAKPAIDTSALLQSIDYEVDGDDVYIGTDVEYAPYIELGTGKYALNGGGTPKESWTYKDDFGNWHMGYPQKARPFLKPAAADHTDEYRGLLKESLENA